MAGKPWFCNVCGHQDYEPKNPLAKDFIVPLTAGGENVQSNWQLVHRQCAAHG